MAHRRRPSRTRRRYRLGCGPGMARARGLRLGCRRRPSHQRPGRRSSSDLTQAVRSLCAKPFCQTVEATTGVQAAQSLHQLEKPVASGPQSWEPDPEGFRWSLRRIVWPSCVTVTQQSCFARRTLWQLQGWPQQCQSGRHEELVPGHCCRLRAVLRLSPRVLAPSVCQSASLHLPVPAPGTA